MYRNLQIQLFLSSLVFSIILVVIKLVYPNEVFLNTLETKTQIHKKCVLLKDVPIQKFMTLKILFIFP